VAAHPATHPNSDFSEPERYSMLTMLRDIFPERILLFSGRCFCAAGQKGHKCLLGLFLDFRASRGQVYAPEAVLGLQGFNARLKFIGRKLTNPCDLELCPLRSALQAYDHSRLQLRAQGAESRPAIGDVDGVCEVSDLVDQDLDRQNHFPALRFAFVQHEETIMVRQRVAVKLRE